MDNIEGLTVHARCIICFGRSGQETLSSTVQAPLAEEELEEQASDEESSSSEEGDPLATLEPALAEVLPGMMVESAVTEDLDEIWTGIDDDLSHPSSPRS